MGREQVEQAARERGYWTVPELAEAANRSQQAVRAALAGRRLTGTKAGWTWLIPFEVGRAWAESRGETG